MTKVICQDFPGPGIFKKKIHDFPGGVGTLWDATMNSWNDAINKAVNHWQSATTNKNNYSINGMTYDQ